MLLPESTTLSITTGEKFFTAVYKRVYTLVVHAQDGTNAIITVKSKDYTPSGYGEGGSDRKLIESQQIKIPTAKNMTAKKWLAKLVQSKDLELFQRTGCDKLNASRQILIREIANQI